MLLSLCLATFNSDPLFLSEIHAPIHTVSHREFSLDVGGLDILREDTIDAFVSGNKYRKLVYNLEEARIQEKECLLTFGGAYSNHIAAVASAGRQQGFKTIGVIRGEELVSAPRNTTLSYAENQGMQLHFISREVYRRKDEVEFLSELREKFDDFYLIPEGGTNAFAVLGCEEILSERTDSYDYICTPVGTGGTMAGLIRASKPHQEVIGFSALKGTFQTSEIEKHTQKSNFRLLDTYCFGGYGKIDVGLVRFINDFKKKTQIPLDPVYTGKMMFGVMDMAKQGLFAADSRILVVHTGGLQGIQGMNEYLAKKNLPQIE